MNFSVDELFDELAHGTDSEELAKGFADALNEAMARQKKEKEKENEKVERLRDILEEIDEWVLDYYPDLADGTASRPEVVIEAMDRINELTEGCGLDSVKKVIQSL